MIVQMFLDLCFTFVSFLISVIPPVALLAIPWTGLSDVIGYGIHVIGTGPFGLIAANILFWSIVHFAAATGDWVYKHLPFI